MLLEAKPSVFSNATSKERTLLRQALKQGEQEELIEDRILTYVNSLKIAANNHNKTKQEAEIYTDWANHYLEKARFKRYVQDLQVDIADGVLLADVIEAVTNEKVKNINRKPKNASQMIENINTCLSFLEGLGVNVDGLVAKDIRDGNLKAILGLFFSLSRHKQQQKQQAAAAASAPRPQATPPSTGTGDMTSRLPSPYRQSSSPRVAPCGREAPASSGIPAPASGLPRNKQLQDSRGRNMANGASQIPSKVPSAASSRSASPSASSVHSLIPQPTLGRQQPADKHPTRPVGSPAGSTGKSSVTLRNPSSATSNAANLGKNSMLDKLKFFNTKDKSERNKAISKRTSSSSGFSSARSERSDSSNSLCSESKVSSSTATSEARESSPIPSTSTSGNSSPRLAVKAFARKTFGRAATNNNNASSNNNTSAKQSSVPSPKGTRKPESSKASKTKEPASKAGSKSADSSGKDDQQCKTSAKSETTCQTSNTVTNPSKDSSNQNEADVPVQLEPENPVRQSSRLSLIPKGSEKVKTAAAGVTSSGKRCGSKDSLTSESAKSVSGISNGSVSTMSSSATASPNPSGVGPGMNIPKPTAAVKGTTKVSKDERRTVSGSSLNLSQNNAVSCVPPSSKDVRSVSATTASTNGKPSKSANKPSKSDASTITDPPKVVMGSQGAINLSSSLPRTSKTDRGRGDNSTTGVSIAMVSPMQSQGKEVVSANSHQDQSSPLCRLISSDGDRPAKPNYAKVDILSHESQQPPRLSPKMSTHSKVETTFDSSDKVITRETNPTQNTTQRETTFSEDADDIIVNIKPMQPILRASPYSYMRNLGVYSSPRAVVPSLHQVGIAATGDIGSSSGVNRMNLCGRHFVPTHDGMQIYASPMKRQMSNGTSILDADYASNIDAVDLANGYMSDGDMLRAAGRGDDIASGYLSEGGASLYARRSQARLKEGLATVKESAHKSSAFLPADSFDDSSSVSSGISDTIAEMSTDDNQTTSSVSSDQTNPYASLKRSPKEVALRAQCCPNGLGGDRGKRAAGTEVSSHNRSGQSRSSSGVKKSDSSQQTDSSAFRQVSSAAWKKYLQDKEAATRGMECTSTRLPPEKMDLLRRGKSDLDPSKAREKRSSGGSNYSSSSSGVGILRKSTTASGAALNGGLNSAPEKCSAGGSPKSKRKVIGSSKNRTSSENLTCDGKLRTGRSGSIDPLSGGNSDKKVQNVRATGLSYVSSKRPTSTCSVSSSGSTKSGGGSKLSSKRTSSDKLSELGRDTTSETASICSESSSSRGYVTVPVSGIPRPGSVVSSKNDTQLSRSTLERNKNKTKSSSNTQTTSNDYQQQQMSLSPSCVHSDSEYSRNSLGRRQKQYAITSPTMGLRDRVFGSRSALNQSPTPGNSDYATIIPNPHASALSRASPRLSVPTKPQELSDASYLVGLEHGSSSSSYAWLRHSPSIVSSLSSVPTSSRTGGGGSLTEAESMESLASLSSASVHAQLQHARANSLTHARLMMHQRETSASPAPRLGRSNSIRSTKSEKLYPSMLQRSGDLDAYLNSVSAQLSSSAQSPVHKDTNHPHHASQPTSPTPGHPMNRGFMCTLPSGMSGSNSAGNTYSPYMGSILSKISNKDDDMHGSTLSLVSNSSSMYSTAEDKKAHEIRKLRRELYEAHDKVLNLTSQLSTNKIWQTRSPVHGAKSGSGDNSENYASLHAQQFQAHVVAAFEQSLSNMTCRLQALTVNAEQKDSELNELRSTIENLRKRSAEAGLTSAGLQSTHHHRSPHLVRRHTFNTSKDTALTEHRMSRQLSTDSMSSINSVSSACSVASQTSGASQKSSDINGLNSKKKKKKGWLRSSFSKAFSRSKKNKNGSVSDVEDVRHLQSDTSAPNSPLLNAPHAMNGQGMKVSHSSSAIYNKEDEPAPPEVVKELKQQLREKDMVLTDIRLEALSSAHQLESLKETVTKMRSEMFSLKQDNERLQRLVSSKSLTSSQSSLPMLDTIERRLSASEMSAQSSVDVLLSDVMCDREGKRVTISVFLGCHGEYDKYIKPAEGHTSSEVLIGSVCVSGKTKWDLLDSLVRRSFKEYVLRVDPVSNLGLNAESVISYHIGDIMRSKDSELPELLPCGYVIGDNMQIRVTLRGTTQNSVDALAFETLIPKSIVQRYISLLTEHRRIILCGPSGTGKTFLAQRLSEFLVLRSGKEMSPGAVATFSVDHKSAKELRQYLSNVAEQCESNAADLPSVIILDNLHHVGSLGEVFNGFLNAKYQKCPYIIGTMNQTTCSTTNLQLHHNFRWILCANHMEPVKGFLGRFLRRKLIEHEVRTGIRNNDLTKVIDWMSKAWQQLNKFLETHSSSDVTIGPRLFLSCPNDISSSQVWFTDLWNYSIVPYLLEAVREGLQLYGRRAAWEDPCNWVMETYPWPPGSQPSDWPSLLRLRPEDVGYDGHPGPGNAANKAGGNSELEADPLLNMLMRLQEAASYSSPHSNDSDNTSLDSHTSSAHNDDAVSTNSESTI